MLAGFAELVVRGGWPLNLTRTVAAAARADIDYVTAITQVDLPTIDRLDRDFPDLASMLLRSKRRLVGRT